MELEKFTMIEFVCFTDLKTPAPNGRPSYAVARFGFADDPRKHVKIRDITELADLAKKIKFSFELPTLETCESLGISLFDILVTDLPEELNPLRGLARTTYHMWGPDYQLFKDKTWRDLEIEIGEKSGIQSYLEILGLDVIGVASEKHGRYYYGEYPYVDIGVVSINVLRWALFLARVIEAAQIKRAIISSRFAHTNTWIIEDKFYVRVTSKHEGKNYATEGYYSKDTEMIACIFESYLTLVGEIVADHPSLRQSNDE